MKDSLWKAVDVVAKTIVSGSEEGKKVERNKGEKWLAVYRRIPA